jgi:serine/threonine protein kinase
MLGSPLYMSPEQVRGEQEAIGPATDIYTLGVMLYEMLAGRRPYSGSKALVLGLIATSRPDPPSKHRPELDPTIEAICLKAMAREPAERYRSMAELAEALGAYLGRPAPQAGSPSASALPGRLPALDEIELAPEDEPEDDRSDAAAEDEEPEVPYEVAKEPPPAPLEWPDPLAVVTTAPVRKPAPRPPTPVVLPKHRSGRFRKFRRTLVDLTYVAICLAILGAGLAFLPRFIKSSLGTVEIQRPSSETRIRIDGREIPAAELQKPIELTVGEHELLATERDTIIAERKIQILPGTNAPVRVRAGMK